MKKVSREGKKKKRGEDNKKWTKKTVPKLDKKKERGEEEEKVKKHRGKKEKCADRRDGEAKPKSCK